MKNTTYASITRTLPALIALLALALAAGCNEEAKPKPSEKTEAEAIIEEDLAPEEEGELEEFDPTVFIDGRDGKKYKIVLIDQIWMAENLNYEAKGSKCYDNKPENCEKYGRLYDWKTALKVCPEGWHLPINDEWEMLMDYVGDEYISGEYIGGEYLKATSGWNDDGSGKSCSGEDKYGFTALPGGEGSNDGTFYYIGEVGYWWSATEHNNEEANINMTSKCVKGIGLDSRDKSSLYSVRCIQGEKPTFKKADTNIFIDERNGKKYKTVKIGEQVWMAENLDYETGRTKERNTSRCYDYETENCWKYGRLYDWEDAIKICPQGWHLPTNEEVNKLYRYVDGTTNAEDAENPYTSETAGKYLKAKSWWNENGNGEDKFGFAALPGGLGNGNTFIYISEFSGWWSASASTGGNARSWSVSYNSDEAYIQDSHKSLFYSVRCLLD